MGDNQCFKNRFEKAVTGQTGRLASWPVRTGQKTRSDLAFRHFWGPNRWKPAGLWHARRFMQKGVGGLWFRGFDGEVKVFSLQKHPLQAIRDPSHSHLSHTTDLECLWVCLWAWRVWSFCWSSHLGVGVGAILEIVCSCQWSCHHQEEVKGATLHFQVRICTW